MTREELLAKARGHMWAAWQLSSEELASQAAETLLGLGMLVPEGGAKELERLRSELAVSEQRSERRRIAWRMARQRAISVGGAADRYAARAREGQTALQDMLAALLAAQIERDAARARVAELEAARHVTNEALDDAVQELRARRDEGEHYASVHRAYRTPHDLPPMVAGIVCRCPEPGLGSCEWCSCPACHGQAPAPQLPASGGVS